MIVHQSESSQAEFSVAEGLRSTVVRERDQSFRRPRPKATSLEKQAVFSTAALMACRGSVLLYGYIAFTAASLLLAYALALAFGHVNALLPHLSYLGDKPTESTIFTQCFVVDAAALAFVVQLRFVEVFRRSVKLKATEGTFALNLAAAWAGHSAAAGLFVLACFQESNAFYVHHLVGVFPYFFGSSTYLTLQTLISARIASDRRDASTLRLRIVISVLAVIFSFIFEGGHIIAARTFDNLWERRTEWSAADSGWRLHLLSAASQWISMFLFLSYFLTFASDFSQVFVTKTRILVILENERASI